MFSEYHTQYIQKRNSVRKPVRKRSGVLLRHMMEMCEIMKNHSVIKGRSVKGAKGKIVRLEKKTEKEIKNLRFENLFIDFCKAFDTNDHNKL